MPISVTCPECNATYRVADEAAGKAIKCKKCGARVPVSAGGDEEEEEKVPAKAGKANDDDEAADAADGGGDDKPKKKAGKGKLFAIIGGALAFVCCCCMVPAGGGGAWYMGWIPGVGGGGGDTGGTIAVGGEKKGTIRKQGEKHDYSVKLEKDKSYVIDMKAPSGDSLLRLFDPSGKEVALNDDAGIPPNGLDAQIKHKATQAGDYKIQATNGPIFLPGTSIAYTLTVKLDSGGDGKKDGKEKGNVNK